MRKLVARGYITEGVILALKYLFSMPKGTDDIHMMFDETVIVINNYMWDPNFLLPSMVSLLMMVGLETHMENIDAGGIFYNFQLSSVLAKYFGVDLGSYLGNNKDRQGTFLCMRWVRLMMGLVLYTYYYIQGLLWASDVVM